MREIIYTLLLAVVILLLSQKVNSFSSVNVTRFQKNDEFTNPNQTAVSNCWASGHSSSFPDTCTSFQSTDTRAVCTSSGTCCELCECDDDYPTYLVHLGKCVNVQELNSAVFGQGSTGCGARFEQKKKDDDFRHGKDDKDCKKNEWTSPLIDFKTSPDPKVKFCRVTPKPDTESCVVEKARYLEYGQWRNITDFKQRFWAKKMKKADIYLQWNDSAVAHLAGNIIVINVSCKQKQKPGRKDFTSCFMFKTAGTHIVIIPSASTTTKPPPPPTTTSASTTTTTTTTTKPPPPPPPITTTSSTTMEATTMKATTVTKETTTEFDSTATPTKRTTTSFSETESSTTSEDRETTSIPVTEPKHKPSEITMATTEWRSPGNDKVIDRSRDGNSSRNTTVIVVSVLCTLAAVAALSVVTVYLLRKWKRPRKAIINDESNIQIDKPENHVYQTQDNIYQLLQRDGKSTGRGQWEPPAYQGLAKGATDGDWGEGEVYTNPSMYQDLTKNEAAYLPAYHPLVKQLQSTTDGNGPEYDCAGYLALVGERGREEDTADVENPYYYKVEQMIE